MEWDAREILRNFRLTRPCLYAIVIKDDAMQHRARLIALLLYSKSEATIVTAYREIQNITDVISKAIPAKKIYLFGSHAYGTPLRDSDYDIYVIIPENVMRPIEAMQKAQRALYSLGDIPPVDVVAATQSKFDIMKNRVSTVERDVAQKGVLLYERFDLGA
ncbi:MAG: nucleotidyltransferase domain-containing protein [Oscillospiraceae bacterium]|jgi:predicted nucleotidyltransferase|nr:nucleotidyltransferase domain-containing protein [Oscillospiraceae bacterium]